MWCGGAAEPRSGRCRRLYVYTCALLVLGAALGAHASSDKRAEMSPVPFVMGSRYGRSPTRLLSPRNDRFFLGSRYGKRAVPPAPALAPGLALDVTSPLRCEFTGVFQLYRCQRSGSLTPRYDDSAEVVRGDRN